ncbi:MAG: hypothetical protein DRP29_04690 [Thermodesulfobacteriota bacterium]|nr:MAG: hypothetical protein DRP29_04690 [Thermodesulfobacteriota bacterium]
MNYPKVVVIILNYNSWKDTIECLESVLRNDYPNYQVIVIDNGSQDNSMEYIKAWAEGRQEDYPLHHFLHFSQKSFKKILNIFGFEGVKGTRDRMEDEEWLLTLNL